MHGLNSKDCILPGKSFKLGTTSFIFPDHIIPNVKKLGKAFDEIELLTFESQPSDVLPSKEDVKELLYLSKELNVTYNIHLPIDVSLTCESREKRQKAVDTIVKVVELFAPLNPSTHTLHIDMPREIQNHDQISLDNWEDRTRQSLGALVSAISDPGIISIETLDYPFCLVETLIQDFNLAVCLDAGHGIVHGLNPVKTFEKHKDRITIMHLHGVDFSGKKVIDHTSLDKLPEKYVGQIEMILKNFTGVVSLEVFNLEKLNRSLSFLQTMNISK